MTVDSDSEVMVQVLRGSLSSRDATFSELSQDFYEEVPLKQYLESTRLKAAAQKGEYGSVQGMNMTPLPCWAIEFQTARRRVGGDYQTIPQKRNGRYKIATARRAEELPGPGQAKKRWRGTRLEGTLSPAHLYSVVTSTYLVPFVIGHRYTAHLPASVNSKEHDSTITVSHEYANTNDRQLHSWNDNTPDKDEQFIKRWTAEAQEKWTEKKTESAPELVTERLNDYGKLEKQQPRRFRVVHTRSRKLYAAVLNPHGTTALGQPFSAAKISSRVDGTTAQNEGVPAEGVICDNKLHYINVGSEGEAYWLMGVLNSTPFEEQVMNYATGDPPNIYSMPAKLLNQMGLIFDSDDDDHLRIIELATELESAMKQTVRRYVQKEKGVNINEIDDSDAGPDIPKMITTPYTNRFQQEDKINCLNNLVSSLLSEAGG